MANNPVNLDVFKQIESLAPQNKAYDWDNVGLQIGSYNQKANKVLVTLDVLESVVDEAIEKNINLIIAHHPLFFKPLKHINLETPEGRIISKLIRHDISVYAAHTNLDVVESGVNDILADRLELKARKPLISLGNEKLFKLAVHIPRSHQEQMKEVLGNAGAGQQGDYSHCSFQIEGEGAFCPMDGAAPYIGKVGKITKVEEVKIEALVGEAKLQEVVNQVKKEHPYEEPAFDIIELQQSGEGWGLGRIGEVDSKVSLEQYVSTVKEKLNVTDVRVIGDLNKSIKRVAIVGGSGEKYIHHAKRAGADVYITGDISFHPAQIALQSSIAVIDAGYYIETFMKEGMQRYLMEALANFDIEVIVSEMNTDPFQYL